MSFDSNIKGLVQEYLKDQYFADKELAISSYLNNKYTGEKENFIICEYTQGKKVVVDLDTNKVYTRNGFLFSVILQDSDYVNAIGNYETSEVLTALSTKFENKYADGEIGDEQNGDE